MNNVVSSIFTIGHSTLSLAELVHRLDAHGIATLADVRSHPQSKRHPHFNRDALQSALGERYVWMPLLGGPTEGEYANPDIFPKHRIGQTRTEFKNMPEDQRPATWWNLGLYEYARWMAGPSFQAGIEQLDLTAQRGKTAIMCAEALWWKCHRSLISDAWVALGGSVSHIMSPTKAQPHTVRDRLLRYEPETRAIWTNPT